MSDAHYHVQGMVRLMVNKIDECTLGKLLEPAQIEQHHFPITIFRVHRRESSRWRQLPPSQLVWLYVLFRVSRQHRKSAQDLCLARPVKIWRNTKTSKGETSVDMEFPYGLDHAEPLCHTFTHDEWVVFGSKSNSIQNFQSSNARTSCHSMALFVCIAPCLEP